MDENPVPLPFTMPTIAGDLYVRGLEPLHDYLFRLNASTPVDLGIARARRTDDGRGTLMFSALGTPLPADFVLVDLDTGQVIPLYIPLPPIPGQSPLPSPSTASPLRGAGLSGSGAGYDYKCEMRASACYYRPTGQWVVGSYIQDGKWRHDQQDLRRAMQGDAADLQTLTATHRTTGCTIYAAVHVPGGPAKIGAGRHAWIGLYDHVSYDWDFENPDWQQYDGMPFRIIQESVGPENQQLKPNAFKYRYLDSAAPQGHGYYTAPANELLGWSDPFGWADLWHITAASALAAKYVAYSTAPGQWFHFGHDLSGSHFQRVLTDSDRGCTEGHESERFFASHTIEDPTLFVQASNEYLIEELGTVGGQNRGGIAMSSGAANALMEQIFKDAIVAAATKYYSWLAIPATVGNAYVDHWLFGRRDSYERVGTLHLGGEDAVKGTGVRFLESTRLSRTYGMSAYLSIVNVDVNTEIAIYDQMRVVSEVGENCTSEGILTCYYSDAKAWETTSNLPVMVRRASAS
ncbi:MAG: hypothetical protein ACT4PT_11275 [Methanobacteriota archaeon]